MILVRQALVRSKAQNLSVRCIAVMSSLNSVVWFHSEGSSSCDEKQ